MQWSHDEGAEVFYGRNSSLPGSPLFPSSTTEKQTALFISTVVLFFDDTVGFPRGHCSTTFCFKPTVSCSIPPALTSFLPSFALSLHLTLCYSSPTRPR